MLSLRIDDRAFLNLIRKWLKAGILDTDGQVLHPVTGTPQGGIVSPTLANVYLHYALDLWFGRVVKPRCGGQTLMIRYADDFVCAFQYRDDAERFYKALPQLRGAPGNRRSYRERPSGSSLSSAYRLMSAPFTWRNYVKTLRESRRPRAQGS